MNPQPPPGAPLTPAGAVSRFLRDNRPFIVVWLALLISMAGIGMVSPLLPKFAEDMGATGIWIALIFSGFALTEVPLMPFVGRLSDRFGRKPFLFLGLLIYAVAAIGYYWAPGYREIFLFRLVSGVGAAMVVPTSYAYVGDLAPRGQEGRYMGVFNIALVIGFGSGPTLGGLVHDAFGLSATFISMAILSGAGFLMVLLFLPTDRPCAVPRPSGQSKGLLPAILKDNTIRAIAVFQIVEGLTYGAVFTFLPIFMTNVRGTTLAQVGLVLSARQMFNGLLAFPSGWLADRLNRVLLVTAGLSILAVGILLTPVVGGFAALFCLFIVVGIAESVALPAGNALSVERGRARGMGSVMGVFIMANSVAIVAGSTGGALIDSSLGISWVFYSAAGACLAGVLVFNFFMRRRLPAA
ncbi:MAG: MFS transporter [Chloroflexi bacterium]|nr:MFS transporter [Chloroflexota bacterium]